MLLGNPCFWLWHPYSHISSADLQSKGGFAACPPSCRSVLCPGKGQAAVGIVAGASGRGPASLAILCCSPYPAVQHPVTALLCFKEEPYCLTCSRGLALLMDPPFLLYCQIWLGQCIDKASPSIFLSFFTTIRLVLTPLFAPQIVNTIYPKSSCYEVCFLTLFGFWRGSVTRIGDLRRGSVSAALGNPPTLSSFLLHMANGLQKGIWASGASGTLMQQPHSVSLQWGPGIH